MTSPLRVLMLVFPLEARGGTAVHVRQWIAGLQERGVEVLLLYSSPDDPSLLELPREVLSRRLASRQLSTIPIHLPLPVLEVLRTYRPHLIHSIYITSDLVGLMISHLTGLPVVSSLEGALLVSHLSPWKRHLLQAAYRRLAPRLAAVTVLSRAAQESLRPLLPSSFASVHVLPLGVKSAAQAPQDRGRAFPHLLFVGRFAPVKALPFLLSVVSRVLPRLPALTLTLVGDGPQREALVRLTEALHLHATVTFVPWLPRDALSFWYRSAHLLLLPSYSEGLPWTALEAMAEALPVMATPVGGLPELLNVKEETRTGFLQDGHDPEVWASRLLALLSRPDAPAYLAEVGARAQAKVRTCYRIEAEIDSLLSIYRQALLKETPCV